MNDKYSSSITQKNYQLQNHIITSNLDLTHKEQNNTLQKALHENKQSQMK